MYSHKLAQAYAKMSRNFILCERSLQNRSLMKLFTQAHWSNGLWTPENEELPLDLSKGEKRRRMYLFITVLCVISWFIKIDLKQIYCSYSSIQKIQNAFR